MGILSMDFETETETIDIESIDTLWARSAQKEQIDDDVAVIVLKIHHPAFSGSTRSYDMSICGKTMTEWVELAFDKCPVLEIETTQQADILETIRPYLSDKKYTAVFYADTPLLQRRTFLSCLDFAQTKRMNVCKFERGYIFVTDYIRTAERLYSSTLPNFAGQQDFMLVCDMDTFAQAEAILKKRIIDFHLQHGVQILDTTWVSIDADVVIGKNTVIYPNNVLQGKTKIGDNVVLQVGNTIINSQIDDNCRLMHSVIVSSKITQNSDIAPFTYIEKGIMKK